MDTPAVAVPPIKLLLIDDERIVAEMVEDMLADAPDIALRHLPDGLRTLDAIREFQPDVVLLDLNMPLVDGLTLVRQVRAGDLCPSLPLLLLSGEDHPEQKARGFADGANDYLVKWPSRVELLARVRYHARAYAMGRQRDEAYRSLEDSQRALLAKTVQLAESQAALIHAQKMEAIGQLTGGVAHDFNNLLQVFSGNIQLLRLATLGNDKAQQRIAALTDGVARGAKLSAQLLAFGRRQSLRPSVIRVSDLIAGMEDLLRRAIGDFTQIETHIAPDVWNVLVDPNQLENVLLNLALNARDAMAGAGKILIEAGNVAGFQPHAGTPDAPAAGEYVKIAVCDTGSGMADDVMQRAFEPFFTTKPVGEGTGLGLSMAYGFVKQSGGHIELHSRVGHGTTVKIYLPRVEQDAGQLRQLGGGAVTGGSETVLVVEDEPEVRSTTVELLQSLGYKTLQASDAQSALTLLQCGLEVDLLFSDVVMPGPLRSDELVVEAQRLRPALKVLFASGYVDERIVRDGQLMAGIELLKKPYSVDDLAQHVRQVLSSKVA